MPLAARRAPPPPPDPRSVGDQTLVELDLVELEADFDEPTSPGWGPRLRRWRQQSRVAAAWTVAALKILWGSGWPVIQGGWRRARPLLHRLGQQALSLLRLSLRRLFLVRLDWWTGLWRPVLGAFAVGCILGLVFTPRGRSERAAVTLERAPPTAVRADLPAPEPVGVDEVPVTVAVAPVSAKAAGRDAVARQLAREAFEDGRVLDGVSYFRIAVRARRWAPGDQTLVASTVDALASPATAPSAERLLRQLGRSARPDLVEAAQSHPDRTVRAKARGLLAPSSGRQRPFLRWVR